MMMTFAGEVSPAWFTPDYEALHEAAADCASMVAALHLTPVVEELLETTRGDLDTANRLNRFAELSSTRQIRVANNHLTMWDFAAGWYNEHDLAQPLIAAFFDAFVGIYKAILVRHAAIPARARRHRRNGGARPLLARPGAGGLRRAYARHPGRFLDALAEARDIAATLVIGICGAGPTRPRSAWAGSPRSSRMSTSSSSAGTCGRSWPTVSPVAASASCRRARVCGPPAAAATCIRSGQ